MDNYESFPCFSVFSAVYRTPSEDENRGTVFSTLRPPPTSKGTEAGGLRQEAWRGSGVLGICVQQHSAVGHLYYIFICRPQALARH